MTKTVTYHRLRVTAEAGTWLAEYYVDVKRCADDHDVRSAAPGGRALGDLRLAAEFDAAEAPPYLGELADELDYSCPSGTGRGGRLCLSDAELNAVLVEGARWFLGLGLA